MTRGARWVWWLGGAWLLFVELAFYAGLVGRADALLSSLVQR